MGELPQRSMLRVTLIGADCKSMRPTLNHALTLHSYSIRLTLTGAKCYPKLHALPSSMPPCSIRLTLIGAKCYP